MPITIRGQNGGHLLQRDVQQTGHHHHPPTAAQPAVAQPQAPTSPHRPHAYHHPQHRPSPSKNPQDNAERPTKRRKLLLKGPRQQTLDNFAFTTAPSPQKQQPPPSPPKPPSKITVTEPHGQLKETLNGVETRLETNVDDIRSRRNTPSRVQSRTSTPQPAAAATTATNGRPDAARSSRQEEKRSLRSHDEGPRLKSELAVYFPNYEDIIFDAPIEPEFITADSALYITDDTAQRAATTATPPSRNLSKKPPKRDPTDSFNGCHLLDLRAFLPDPGKPSIPDDPLTEARYIKAHNRAERKEKQLRNIERERAMHEKASLERLLGGLQSHDWLKVLGITGITDSEARKYEPKREFFEREVSVLVGKFRQWKDEERRLRLLREKAVREQEEEDEDEEETDDDDDDDEAEPSSSDLNASATKQLQRETLSALKTGSRHNKGNTNKRSSTPSTSSTSQQRQAKPKQNSSKASTAPAPADPARKSGLTLKLSRARASTPSNTTPHTTITKAKTKTPPPPPPVPLSPITTFYPRAPAQRAAALARHNFNSNPHPHSQPLSPSTAFASKTTKTEQGGGEVLAFGLPLPEMPEVEEERDFELPGVFRTAEALKASARERRARRRGRVSEGDGRGKG